MQEETCLGRKAVVTFPEEGSADVPVENAALLKA